MFRTPFLLSVGSIRLVVFVLFLEAFDVKEEPKRTDLYDVVVSPCPQATHALHTRRMLVQIVVEVVALDFVESPQSCSHSK